MIAEKTAQAQLYDQQTQLFKLLTHPVRLAILEILRVGEHCVCHMEAHLGYRQAYISQQVAVLREAGLIRDRRDGWNIFLSHGKRSAFHNRPLLLSGSSERNSSPLHPLPERAAGIWSPYLRAAAHAVPAMLPDA